MIQWPTAEGIWLTKNQLQVLSEGFARCQCQEFSTWRRQTHPSNASLGSSLLGADSSLWNSLLGKKEPHTALPVQEPVAARIQQLPVQGKQGLFARARECSAPAAGNEQGTGSRQEHISLQGSHPHFLGQLEALGNPTRFH